MKQCQSYGLSQRHHQLHSDGKHLCCDSSVSEGTLKDALIDIIKYAKNKIESYGATMEYKTSISLYECQEAFQKCGGPVPNVINKKVFMKPDGGVIFACINDNKYPILIVEDKVQGTNDSRLTEGKPKQSLGNAIERAAKNIRGCEMLCSNTNVFPYVIFASGCDFHHTETISKRLEMMNFGISNHYIEITEDIAKQPHQIELKVNEECEKIYINKISGYGIATIFIKSHKWDKMSHGSSKWTKTEIITVCKCVIDQAIDAILK